MRTSVEPEELVRWSAYLFLFYSLAKPRDRSDVSRVTNTTKNMNQITYQDFDKIEIRVGKIIKTEAFPKARKPAYKLWIDFGEFGIKKSSACLTKLYRHEELVGKSILAVTNFPPRQVADFMSEVLVLGAVMDDGEVALVQPDRDVSPGIRIL